MAANEKIRSIDDILAIMRYITETTEKKIQAIELGKKFIEIMNEGQNDPDVKFKANMMMRSSEIVQALHMMVEYLCRPVRAEGVLIARADGTPFLGNEMLNNNTGVEYYANDMWNYGIIHKDNEKYKCSIISINSGVAVEDANGIRIRVR